MEEAGRTDEDKTVMSGVGTMCFTRGIPLEIVLSYFHANDLVVDWVDYIATAFKDGHRPRTIRARIESAVSDIYGGAYAREVLVRADKVISYFADSAPPS